MLVKSLRDRDKVSIVTYGGVAGIYLPPTAGSEKEKIIKAIEELECGGTTPGSGGIHLAYQLATTNPIPNGNNRVILATDGDFNVGPSGEKELENLIISYRKTGVSLTCLGVGMGNFKDSKIETLARFGNGNYAYLDNEQEAERVMVQELTQNLYAVASDVTIHIKLDPLFMKQYRLIGYENRRGAVYHKNSMLVGGEIGSGFPINALFEIVLSDSSGGFITRNYDRQIGSLVFRYVDASKPEAGLQERVYPLRLNYVPLNETDRKIRFITAVAIYGSLLKKSEAFSGMNFSGLLELAKSSADPNDQQQSAFPGLVAETEKIYFPPEPPGKKKMFPSDKKKK